MLRFIYTHLTVDVINRSEDPFFLDVLYHGDAHLYINLFIGNF